MGGPNVINSPLRNDNNIQRFEQQWQIFGNNNSIILLEHSARTGDLYKAWEHTQATIQSFQQQQQQQQIFSDNNIIILLEKHSAKTGSL